MFVVISIVVSISIIALLLFLSKQNSTVSARRYHIVMDMRQVLLLCRQHRGLSHKVKLRKGADHAVLQQVEAELIRRVTQLVDDAPFESKPLYRVLEIKVKAMLNQWQDVSVAKNQMVHGKVIRHCMYLLDDVVLAWLAESGRDDLYETYHYNWQAVLDAMETLTRLRIAIQEQDTPCASEQVRYYCGHILQRMNRLKIIDPEIVFTPQCHAAMTKLNEISESELEAIDANTLYGLTSEISTAISDVYDDILKSFSEQIYQPLAEVEPVTAAL
ncbi:hypothetical protein [Vibrio sp. WXL103]|uniref:hypothetical protein n=1 Tax=unclassified Vibrio TaxID=2614977 RepID=UPI003EC8C879